MDKKEEYSKNEFIKLINSLSAESSIPADFDYKTYIQEYLIKKHQ